MRTLLFCLLLAGCAAAEPPAAPAHQPRHCDTLPTLKPGATRDEVLEAAKGHVVGGGDLIGTYQQTTPPLK